jgi:hypothetical protein
MSYDPVCMLVDRAADLFEIDGIDILTGARRRDVSMARWAIIHVLTERYAWYPSRIARALAINHASVIYALRELPGRLADDPSYADLVAKLLAHTRRSRRRAMPITGGLIVTKTLIARCA